MPIELWIAFVVASSLLLLMPGPTILTVISYSVAQGRRANLPLIAAVALGDASALLFSLIGLGALLATSAFWFTLVKWVGGLYLLYLGIKLLRAGTTTTALPEAATTGSRWTLFAHAYVVTALNPKGIVFFIAFLPQFVSPEGNITQQLWLLSATFVILATLNTTLYLVFARNARRLLAQPQAQRRFNLVGGSLLSAAGIWALLARRAV